MKKGSIIFSAILLTATTFGQATPDPSSEKNYSTEVENSSSASEPSVSDAVHYLGEYYGGGIVFYVDEEGKHGLITATIDKETRKLQKSEAFILTNQVRDGITTGKFNTDRINAMKGAGAIDAQERRYYEDKKLSDWYLATGYDLMKLYRNRAVIGGYAEFAKGWKSTEVSSVNEWFESFVTGGEFSNGKDDAVYIRVVRNF